MYDKVFHGPARVTVAFGDVVEYAGDGHALFAGRDGVLRRGRRRGAPADPHEPLLPVRRRPLAQFHHHSRTDDADEPAAYQAAIRG
ncbi:hypothetical protein L1857_23410 [Amycolatopsis thermalba]|uniref:Uncharacterized protein n=1 Tax=Amycolatopsis thermalba TaxID=944492 RepID=A0ABY4NZP0_9PSEU|nr:MULTISPECIES: hypothetical protein [Amycolatopsis]UQS25550.1 hypothetical protein L1857_23410 [Amycolatopsis thermalba]